MSSDLLLNQSLEVFLLVLRSGWEAVEALARTNRDPSEVSDVLAEWAQGNWETIVEASLFPSGGGFLEFYGEDADRNSIGSRVWKPGAESTHEIRCMPRVGNDVLDVVHDERVQFPKSGIVIDRFATPSADGWYVEQPPFDHVLVSGLGQDTLFRLADVTLHLSRL